MAVLEAAHSFWELMYNLEVYRFDRPTDSGLERCLQPAQQIKSNEF